MTKPIAWILLVAGAALLAACGGGSADPALPQAAALAPAAPALAAHVSETEDPAPRRP